MGPRTQSRVDKEKFLKQRKSLVSKSRQIHKTCRAEVYILILRDGRYYASSFPDAKTKARRRSARSIPHPVSPSKSEEELRLVGDSCHVMETGLIEQSKGLGRLNRRRRRSPPAPLQPPALEWFEEGHGVDHDFGNPLFPYDLSTADFNPYNVPQAVGA